MDASSVKRPSFQFYPGDWLNDAALRMVSVGARGLWIEMICLMHQGSDYGYLKVNGKVILPANLARMSGATLDEATGWISELEDAGVFARDEDGCIFSKRMIRDERVRAARAAGGKLGGNPVLVKKGKDNLTLNLDLTPSSSSSSSSSDEKPKPSSSAGADGDEVGEPEPEKAKPFDHFWSAYPRRVGKQDALKAWTKIKPDNVLLSLILKAIENQKQGADWRKDDGQFIPYPATWLRAGRWLDEVRPYVAPAPKLPAGWWETKDGMEAAGRMLNPPLTPRPGEYPKEFAQRIREAMGEVDPLKGYTPLPPLEKIVPAYVPPTVPEGVQLTPEQRQARRDELREAMKAMSEKAGNARAGVAASNERQEA